MFLIASITKLDKRWCLSLIFMFVLVLIISAVGLFFYIQGIQIQQKAISLEKSISTLKMQAIKAEHDGDLGKADILYTKALDDAYDSNCPMKVIEIFSRLVQTKIRNHKMGQAEPLVQKAIQLALFIKGTDASDSNLEVWMDDMANTFYKRGEHSTRDDIKEYCLKHYLDIKLPIEDHFDQILVSRAVTLTNYLDHTGRASEASPYEEKFLDYRKRIKPNDPEVLASPYFSQANNLAKAHQLMKAELALRQGFAITNPGDTLCNKAAFYFSLARLAEKADDPQRAITLYQKVIDLEKQAIGNSAITEYSVNVLAFLEERLGHLTEAAKLYNESLDCLKRCSPPKATPANAFLHSDGCYFADKVFAAEHLANIELKRGNLAFARALTAQAKAVRARNPHWAQAKHPDPDSFYLQGGWLGGFYPFQIEIIPTRISLQEINPN